MGLGSPARTVSLKRWLQVSFAGFAGSLLVALGLAVWPLVGDYLRAERNMRSVEAYGELLTAANRISAERGPSNVMMSIQPGSDEAAAARLAAFRTATDRSLEQILALPRTWTDQSVLLTLGERIGEARRLLQTARLAVDEVAALPIAMRQSADTRQAIDGMIAVADSYQSVLDISARVLAHQDPSLIGATLIAQSASDLREFGGRIASGLIPAVSLGEKLSADELDRFVRTEGRLLEIERLLRTQTLFEDDETARRLAQDIRQRFFGDGLNFLRRLVAKGREGGRYGADPAVIMSVYVPTLKPLEDLRVFALSHMIETFKAQSREALTRLLLTLVCSALFLALAFRFLYSVRTTILIPLMAARDMVVSLADNRPARSLGSQVPINELRTLFSAIAVLAQQTSERRRLLEQFRAQAETDRLTGLANRRRFEALATQAMKSARAGQMGLLYFDLDLFKRVNDTFGHHAGDEVLVEVARRLEALVAGQIVLARLGGDEFAVLCIDLDEAVQRTVAEAILAVLSEPFEIEGRRLRIGSSIGIAVLRDEGVTFETLCRQADIALYQAKATGRNRFCVYADGMEAAFQERNAAERDNLPGDGRAGAEPAPSTPSRRRLPPAA